MVKFGKICLGNFCAICQKLTEFVIIKCYMEFISAGSGT